MGPYDAYRLQRFAGGPDAPTGGGIQRGYVPLQPSMIYGGPDAPEHAVYADPNAIVTLYPATGDEPTITNYPPVGAPPPLPPGYQPSWWPQLPLVPGTGRVV